MSLNTVKPSSTVPPLNESQLVDALTELNNTEIIHNFPKIQRRYADPPLYMQSIGLISFTPSEGATPDKNGFFGFAKLRGNFDTEVEANERAEYLVQNIDSYNKIFHVYVGRPFPITSSSDYSKVIKEVDVHKIVAEEISKDIKKKRMEEKKEIETIKEREKNLQSEVDRESKDTDDVYITLRTKKAQLIWTYLESLKKIDQMKENIIKTRKEIADMDSSNPELNTMFFDKFMKARKDAGFKDDKDSIESSFLKYMIQDIELDL